MEILTCEDVVKTYGQGETRVEALCGVSLRVERGAFVAIVGASGSGKSTLLYLIAGVDKPTSGRVCVEGTDLATLDRTRSALFRRRRVAMVYQSYNLIPTLTARENLLLPLRLDRREAETGLFTRVTRSLNIEDKLDRLPSQLSGGEQQRVAVAPVRPVACLLLFLFFCAQLAYALAARRAVSIDLASALREEV